MIVKLLTEHHLEFLSLKGGCKGWSESTLVKSHIVGNLMPRLIYKLNNAIIKKNYICFKNCTCLITKNG